LLLRSAEIKPLFYRFVLMNISSPFMVNKCGSLWFVSVVVDSKSILDFRHVCLYLKISRKNVKSISLSLSFSRSSRSRPLILVLVVVPAFDISVSSSSRPLILVLVVVYSL